MTLRECFNSRLLCELKASRFAGLHDLHDSCKSCPQRSRTTPLGPADRCSLSARQTGSVRAKLPVQTPAADHCNPSVRQTRFVRAVLAPLTPAVPTGAPHCPNAGSRSRGAAGRSLVMTAGRLRPEAGVMAAAESLRAADCGRSGMGCFRYGTLLYNCWVRL